MGIEDATLANGGGAIVANESVGTRVDVGTVDANGKPKFSRYANTMYNRYDRVLTRAKDVLSITEQFRLTHARMLERLRTIYASDDWRRLGRVERARISGYIEGRISAWYWNRGAYHVWILEHKTEGMLFDRIEADGSALCVRDKDGTVKRLDWSDVIGGAHYWQPDDKDIVKWRNGLMTTDECWHPW